METLHPVAAHFAVVLPLVALVLQVTYMAFKSSVLQKASTLTLLVATLTVVAAYLTGGNDAQNGVYETLSMFNAEGKAVLIAHSKLGLFVLILLAVTTVAKMVACKFSHKWLDAVVFALMFTATIAMFNQGKIGGEIVYKHGAIFEAHGIKDTLKTALEDAKEETGCDDKMSLYEDEIKSALKIEE